MFFVGVVFLCVPLLYSIFIKKRKMLIFLVSLILICAVVLSIFLSGTITSLNTNTMDIFSSAKPIDSDNGNISEGGIDYRQFIIQGGKKLKNILVLASDQRPDKSSESTFRTDIIILLSIEIDTRNMYVFTLPRDTIVRYDADDDTNDIGAGKVCKLTESVVYAGGVQGLVNTIRLNYGLDIDEYIIVTWRTFINVCDTFFDGHMQVPLTDIEVLGINQTLPKQNENFGRKLSKDSEYSKFGEYEEGMFLEYDETDTLGRKQLEYLHKEGLDHKLFDINNILQESSETELKRTFDETTEIVYDLDSYQLLAYVRDRHPYKSQDLQRERNTLTLLSQMLPVILSHLNDEEMITKFSSLCKEYGGIETTYTSLSKFIEDVFIPIKSIHIGKNIDGDNVTQIPYRTYNYSAELEGTFNDVRNQTKRLLFGKE